MVQLFQTNSQCSSIYHAHKHTRASQKPPAIHLPPPSLPNYITSSRGSKPSLLHVGKKKPQAEDDGKARENAAALHQRVLDSKPGSSDTRELFNTLHKEIASILPHVKHQRRFVTDLCKAAWYKAQGGLLCSSYVIFLKTNDAHSYCAESGNARGKGTPNNSCSSTGQSELVLPKI